MTIKEKADAILYERGLMAQLEKLGRPHLIGSCRMDMMAWNDIDIDIENDGMSLEKLYQLTAYILEAFPPFWYEAKEEVNDEGKTVWFQGFEAMIDGERWNFDLWFFDRETIEKAEAFCDGIAARATAEQKEIITTLKRELIARDLYSFEKFHSMDVYRAVLKDGIKDVNAFLKEYKRDDTMQMDESWQVG